MKNSHSSYMTRDRYAENLGIKLVDVEKEYAHCELSINENHKIAHYQACVTDSHGTCVAQFCSIAYRFPGKE